VPGRGLTSDGLVFQVAVPEARGEWVAAAGAWAGEPAPPVLSLPALVTRQDLVDAQGSGLRLGVAGCSLAPIRIDVTRDGPHFLVFGDSESGRTNLLRAFAHDLSADGRDRELAVSVVDYRRRLEDLAEADDLWRYSRSPQQVHELAGELVRELSDREPGDTPPAARRHYLLVDDYDWVSSSAGNPLAALTDFLLMGQDIGFHVVLARRVGGTARCAFEPFFQRLREMGSPGLILSGDPYEGPLLGGHRAAPQPPGRGLLVRPAQKAVLVQTVHAPPLPVPTREEDPDDRRKVRLRRAV